MYLFAVPLLTVLLAAAPEDQALRAVFDAAAQSLRTGDLDAAERGFQQVLKSNPNHIGALGNLGVVFNREDRPGDAAAVYRRALALAPADPLLNLNLGLACLRQEDYLSARRSFETAVASDPQNPQARQLLATAQLFTGQTKAALEELERLRPKHDPGVLYLLSVGYLRQGKRTEAARIMDEMFSLVSPAQAQFLTGKAWYESTLFEEAAAALEKARQLEPALDGVDRELGKTYVSLRKSAEARQALQKALQANPRDAEARYFLGALLVQEGDMQAAIPMLEKARLARPDFWGNHYYLGKAFLYTDLARAIPLLERSAALNPEESQPWYLLARAYRKAGRTADAQRAGERLRALKK